MGPVLNITELYLVQSSLLGAEIKAGSGKKRASRRRSLSHKNQTYFLFMFTSSFQDVGTLITNQIFASQVLIELVECSYKSVQSCLSTWRGKIFFIHPRLLHKSSGSPLRRQQDWEMSPGVAPPMMELQRNLNTQMMSWAAPCCQGSLSLPFLSSSTYPTQKFNVHFWQCGLKQIPCTLM